MRALFARQGDLRIALDHRNHVAADGFRHLHKHQADRPAANDRHGVADLDPGFMQAAQNAGQRLGHRGILEAHIRRHDEHIGFHNAARNPDVLGVGAIVEQQIFAKVQLVLGAIEAHAAGSRVERHHAHALLEAAHALADFLDRARQFMPEQRRRHNHAGVIAALIHLQIGAAGERHVDLDQNFALTHTRDRHSFNLDVFFAVEDGGRHLAVHS